MWLYLIALPVAVLIIVGSVFMGGVYTIVAIPVVLLALAGGVLWRALGRVTVERSGSGSAGSGHGPATPGELADARRAQQ
jgi:uncharacterized protein (DUF58 family)